MHISLLCEEDVPIRIKLAWPTAHQHAANVARIGLGRVSAPAERLSVTATTPGAGTVPRWLDFMPSSDPPAPLPRGMPGTACCIARPFRQAAAPIYGLFSMTSAHGAERLPSRTSVPGHVAAAPPHRRTVTAGDLPVLSDQSGPTWANSTMRGSILSVAIVGGGIPPAWRYAHATPCLHCVRT
jgi:hypothetical protein